MRSSRHILWSAQSSAEKLWHEQEFILATGFKRTKSQTNEKRNRSQGSLRMMNWQFCHKSMAFLSHQVLGCIHDLVQPCESSPSHHPSLFFCQCLSLHCVKFNHSVFLFCLFSLSVHSWKWHFDVWRKPRPIMAHRISNISKCSWIYLQSYWHLPPFICPALCVVLTGCMS